MSDVIRNFLNEEGNLLALAEGYVNKKHVVIAVFKTARRFDVFAYQKFPVTNSIIPRAVNTFYNVDEVKNYFTNLTKDYNLKIIYSDFSEGRCE